MIGTQFHSQWNHIKRKKTFCAFPTTVRTSIAASKTLSTRNSRTNDLNLDIFQLYRPKKEEIRASTLNHGVLQNQADQTRKKKEFGNKGSVWVHMAKTCHLRGLKLIFIVVGNIKEQLSDIGK